MSILPEDTPSFSTMMKSPTRVYLSGFYAHRDSRLETINQTFIQHRNKILKSVLKMNNELKKERSITINDSWYPTHEQSSKCEPGALGSIFSLQFHLQRRPSVRPPLPLPLSHRTGRGCWVIRRPKRFFTVTLCLENLSSGEKRAGWAELVGCPSGQIFCWWRRRKAKR